MFKDFAASRKVYPHVYRGAEFYVFSSRQLANQFCAAAGKAGFSVEIRDGHPSVSGHGDMASVVESPRMSEQEVQSREEAGW